MTKIRDKLAVVVTNNCEIVYVSQDQPWTSIDIVFEFADNEFRASGYLKVKWPDKWDPDYGQCLAKQKAVYKIVKAIMKDSELAQSIGRFYSTTS